MNNGCHLNNASLFLAPFKSQKDAPKGQPALVHAVIRDPGSPHLLGLLSPIYGCPGGQAPRIWLASYFHLRSADWNPMSWPSLTAGEVGSWSHWAIRRAKGQSRLLTEKCLLLEPMDRLKHF